MKVSEEMSQEVKQYLKHKGQLCLNEGVLYWCRSQMQRDHNELQLVVLPNYRMEAIHGAHNDVGHLGLEQMLDILCNRFYWPNIEANATCHVHTWEQCLRFMSKQDKAELYLLLATYPLELVHMDFLTMENPHTSADHECSGYYGPLHPICKSNSNQSAKMTAMAFWNEYITNYSFTEQLLMDQGCNFEPQLIEELCKLAHIHKVWTIPYHLETNGQCERFSQKLINMIGTWESDDKQHWKGYLPTWYMPIIVPRTLPWILALLTYVWM